MTHNVPRWLSCVLRCYAMAVYVFLYLPLVTFCVYSFNNARFPGPWSGFTLQWYRELFADEDLVRACINSLVTAGAAVALSAVLGLGCIFYVMQRRRGMVTSQFYINLIFPEIVLAVGLLRLITMCNIPRGFMALLAGHTVLGLGYMVPLLYAQSQRLSQRLLESAYDLGASSGQAFVRVVLPLLRPALYAGGILVFIISFDDFVIAYFCSGATFQTLPVYIFSMIRTGVSPSVNALSTVLLVISGCLVLVYTACQSRLRGHM